MSSRLAIDFEPTGLTLTLFNSESGRLVSRRVPASASATIAERPDLVHSLTGLVREASVEPSALVQVLCCLTPKAAEPTRTGILVTRGHEHWLSAQARRRLRALDLPDPDPALTRGIDERVTASGDVLSKLDEPDAAQQIQTLLSRGVQAIAVSLMHAALFPAHEQRICEIISRLNAQLPVFASHDARIGANETGRTLACLISAGLQASTRQHLAWLQEQLLAVQIKAPVYVVQSTGSLCPAADAIAMPALILRGRAAASSHGAARAASRAGISDAIAMHMDSYCTEVTLIRRGQPRMGANTIVVDPESLQTITLAVPSVDARYVGGGSDTLKGAINEHALTMVHRSPAENSATLANAREILGQQSTSSNSEASKRAEPLAQALAVAPQRVAAGMLGLANEQFAGAVRSLATEKGQQITNLALVMTGAGGAQHACAMARLTGASPVVVPPRPDSITAIGACLGQSGCQFTRAVNRRLDELDIVELQALCGPLNDQAKAWLADQSAQPQSAQPQSVQPGSAQSSSEQTASLVWLAELTCQTDPEHWQDAIRFDPMTQNPNTIATLTNAFVEGRQKRLVRKPDTPIMLLSVRLVATRSGPSMSSGAAALAPGDRDARSARTDHQQVVLRNGFEQTPVFNRDDLQPGHEVTGPALVTERHMATPIEPGYTASIDQHRNLLIQAASNG